MNTRAVAVRSIALVLLAGLPACTAVGPNYTPPKVDVPAAWSGALQGGTTAAPIADLSKWWSVLNDPTLDSLIARSIEGSKTLKIARARVLEARALRGVVSTDRLPTIDANGNYERSRQSDNAGGQRGGGRFQSSDGVDNFQVGLDASWELDVWGRIRRNIEAADADLDASIESQRDTLVTLTADVARAYVDLRSLQRRLEIARENVRIQQETVQLSRARFEAGLSSELDLSRATAQLATTQSQIPSIEAGISVTIYRLSVLVGQQPSALVAELTPSAAIPALPTALPVGLPSELLRRRPDVRAAERQLAAATARVGVATAELFPRFSLTGSFGLASSQFGELFDMNSRFWGIGPSLQWNVFNRDRLKELINAADARTQQSLASYEASVLRAFEDVEGALTSYSREQERQKFLEQAVVADQRSVELAKQLYARGLTDFFSVLDTQRRLFDSQDAQVQSQQAVTQNLVTLYRALGGGWDPNQPGGSPSFEPAPAETLPAGSEPLEPAAKS